MAINVLDRICPHCGFPAGGGPASALHLPPGTLLQNKYIIGRSLGQDGFGITYLAWDKTLNLKLAVKEYLPRQLVVRTDSDIKVTVFKQSLAAEFSSGREKFLEEAKKLSRFSEHPQIVSVRDFFEANGTGYMVMNYHEGVTLLSYLQSRGGRIVAEQAVKMFLPLLDALKELHAAGIIHRDIGPDSLLINTAGRVTIIDFGAAKQEVGEESKGPAAIMKAGFSPLEQYHSRGKQGPWTDIYAVAATMYRAVTGQAPPEAMDRLAEDNLVTPSRLGVVIDAGVEQALLKALAVKTEDRYQAVEDFRGDLLKAGSGRPLTEEYAGVDAKKPVERLDVKVEKKESAAAIEVNLQNKPPGNKLLEDDPAGIKDQVVAVSSKDISYLGVASLIIGLVGAAGIYGAYAGYLELSTFFLFIVLIGLGLGVGELFQRERRKSLAVAGTATSVLVMVLMGLLPTGLTTLNPACRLAGPEAPLGLDGGIVDTNYSYTTKDYTCAEGCALEFRFDWNDGTYSPWSPLQSANHSWFNPGEYNIRVQSRCSVNPDIESEWSSPLVVNLVQELPVTAPLTPTLVSPADKDIVDAETITFHWEALEEAESYKIRLMRSSDGSVVMALEVGDATSYTKDGFPNDGTDYSWTVAAGNSAGWSEWSAYRTFTSGSAPESPPEVRPPSPPSDNDGSDPTCSQEESERIARQSIIDYYRSFYRDYRISKIDLLFVGKLDGEAEWHFKYLVGYTDSMGVGVVGRVNVTVKNCQVTDFDR